MPIIRTTRHHRQPRRDHGSQNIIAPNGRGVSRRACPSTNVREQMKWLSRTTLATQRIYALYMRASGADK